MNERRFKLMFLCPSKKNLKRKKRKQQSLITQRQEKANADKEFYLKPTKSINQKTKKNWLIKPYKHKKKSLHKKLNLPFSYLFKKPKNQEIPCKNVRFQDNAERRVNVTDKVIKWGQI